MPGPCRLWPWAVCMTQVVVGVVLFGALIIAATWVLMTIMFAAVGQL